MGTNKITKGEALTIIRGSLHSVKQPKLRKAIHIALKALAWESAHEKMLELTEKKEIKLIK